MRFGSNGVVASYISLSSYEIVLLRSLLGSAMLSAIFVLTGCRSTALKLFFAFAAVAVLVGCKQGAYMEIAGGERCPILWVGWDIKLPLTF